VTASPGFPFDEAWVRQRTEVSYDRCYHPMGRLGHAQAVAGAKDHTAELGGVTAPTVVIHGAEDPLVSPLGGEATAKAIPGAELVTIPGMGHDLPRGAWPTVIEAIVKNAGRR
jgi:pimeloyl-ACP methyl ester carboxylesterase